jgi:hypothetical protein
MFGKIKSNRLRCQILVQNVTADAQCFDARPFFVATYLIMLFPASWTPQIAGKASRWQRVHELASLFAV